MSFSPTYSLRGRATVVSALIAACAATGGKAAPPPNDHFAAAEVHSGAFWLAQGTLHGATSETNEPVLTGYPNGPTAWWRWTAPFSGQVRVLTWGSEEASLLAVYRGATLDTTRLIAWESGHANVANAAEVVFTAEAGTVYSIQVLGADVAAPDFIPDPALPGRVQVSLTPLTGTTAAPANDSFAGALVLTGATAEVVVNNAGATSQPGEPLDLPGARGNTVWLSWTAPGNGVWQADTQQGDHDTLTAIYTGPAVNSLTRIDFSDHASSYAGNPWARGGRVTFQAVAGQTYRVQIMGASQAGAPADFGNVKVTLQPVQPPANDNFAAASALTGPAPSAEGWSTFATREAGEPAAQPDESRSLWWRWTAPAAGLLAVIRHRGEVTPFTGTALANLAPLPFAPNAGGRSSQGAVTDWYTVTVNTTIWLRGGDQDDRVVFSLRTVQPPANDNFADRKTLTGATVTDTVDLEYASWENNEPETDGLGPQTAWYRWTAPAAGRYVIHTQGSPSFTRVAVFTGSVLNSLNEAGDEALHGFLPSAYGRVFLNAAAGTEYAIQLQRESIVTGLDRINIRPSTPPANDNFASAITMTGSSWSTTGSNSDATFEDPAEPGNTLSGSSSFASVWWKWTAPAAGLYRVSTAGSAVDTVLVVYTGAALNALTRVAQNQDAGWGSTGALTFAATAGTTCHFNVDGQARTEGALKLTLAPVTGPPNDAFAARLVLAGSAPFAIGSVLGATAEAGEPVISGATRGRSVWYEWTAPAGGTAFFRVTAQRFTPVVGIYTGNTLNALQAAVSGGSGAPSTTEQTFFVGYPVSAGSAYKILIDGNPAENGEFRVSVSMPAPPVNDAFEQRFKLNGSVVRASASNEGATGQNGEPSHAGSNPGASVWWEWTAPAAGPVTIDTAGGTAQARLAIYTGTALNALTPVVSEVVTFPETFSRVTFNAAAGTTYMIAADSSDRQRGEIALTIVTGAAAAPNDRFAAATAWNTDQAEALVRPLAASNEAGEPPLAGRPAAKSLWWKWTPQTTRRARVWMQTEGEPLRARVVIYKGAALNSLTALSAQTTDGLWTRREVDVVAGETYYIVLDTPAEAVDPGWIRLGVVPVNGTQDNALLLQPGGGPVAADLRGAFNEDAQQAPSAVRQLWWAWVPEVNARMEWRVTGSQESGAAAFVSATGAFTPSVTGQTVPGSGEVVATFDTVAGETYFLRAQATVPEQLTVQLTEAPRQVPPSNDRQYRATPMAGASWSQPFTLGAESGDRLFWTWTAPAAGVVQVQLTGSLAEEDALLAYADGYGELTAGATGTNGGPPVLRLASVAGQQWTLATRTGLRRLRPATLALTPAPGTPPPNDSFLTPQVLSSSWNEAAGDVTFASCQPDERDHSASGGTQAATTLPPGRSVWYDWTPANSGPVTLRLDSAEPLAMRLYAGRSEAQWREEAFLKPGERTLSTWLNAGQTYHIAVATRPWQERTAAFTLRRGGPPNDALADAVTLNGATASHSVDSAGATAEAGEPGYGFSAETAKATLWWKWSPPAAGLVTIDTGGSEFDTVLTVFSSNPPEAASRIAENDNASSRPGATASAVALAAVPGQTWWIRISRRDAAEPSGTARINLTMNNTAGSYERWRTDWPALNQAGPGETEDPDRDGLSNLAELAMGTNPLAPDGDQGGLRIVPAEDGWAVEARLDRDALEPPAGSGGLEAVWQLSSDLRTWQPGPPSVFVRKEGRFSVERLILQPGDPPFARLLVRKIR